MKHQYSINDFIENHYDQYQMFFLNVYLYYINYPRSWETGEKNSGLRAINVLNCLKYLVVGYRKFLNP